MTWGEANKAFSQNEMQRDYARLSSSLDAADQSAGFRPADQLTHGVAFTKPAQLSFEGFAQGKQDASTDSYVRQMTPYMAASHYMNQMRKPQSSQFL
jgi:hypothetical protein